MDFQDESEENGELGRKSKLREYIVTYYHMPLLSNTTPKVAWTASQETKRNCMSEVAQVHCKKTSEIDFPEHGD